jgi:hypothetical protein
MAWDGDHFDGIIEVIKQYCEEEGVKYRQVDERGIHAGFQGRNFSYQLLARAREGHRQAFFISMVPVKIQPEQRPVVAEFLCRANFGLILGNFELDYETGEVRYKTSVDVTGGELTSRMVKTQFDVNLATVDKYAKGLIGILYRGLTPAQAIAEIEEVSATMRLAAQAAMN